MLTGGYDRQAEDLLFGGDGDDTFQILPDVLPFLKGTTETFIPTVKSTASTAATATTASCSWAATTTASAAPVPDEVAIRWNRFLHRYEFTALQWDTANQQFVPDGQAVNALGRGPNLGAWTAPSTRRADRPGGVPDQLNGGDLRHRHGQPDPTNAPVAGGDGLADLVADIQDGDRPRACGRRHRHRRDRRIARRHPAPGCARVPRSRLRGRSERPGGAELQVRAALHRRADLPAEVRLLPDLQRRAHGHRHARRGRRGPRQQRVHVPGRAERVGHRRRRLSSSAR